MPNAFGAGRTGGSRGPAHGPHSVAGRQSHKPPQPLRTAPKQQEQEQQEQSSSAPQQRLPNNVQQPQRQQHADPTAGLPSQAPAAPTPQRGPQRRKTKQPSPAAPHPGHRYDTGVNERQSEAYAVTDSGSQGPNGAVRQDRNISGGGLFADGADDQDVSGGIYSSAIEGDGAGDYLVRHTSSRTQTRRGWARAEEEQEQEEEEDEEPLRSELAKELRELERLYGAPNRTRNSYRTRQERLDRRAAARAAVYGPRHRDADVRLLALRREMAAGGSLRRRGRFATDDAMPRRSTWHKLLPRLQQQILDERASELLRAVGLSRPAGRRLYLAAPGLLCDISYGVANRLRALASRLGVTVEAAAAAVAARPLLGEMRPDILEATAAELAVWLGGMPLPVVLQRLVEEPAVAVEGPAAIVARCQALSDSLGLTRMATLQLVLRNPRLMAVEPRDVADRVAAARRIVRQAAEADDVSGGAATGCVAPGGAAATAAAGGDSQVCASGGGGAGGLPPPGLMLCTEAQLDSCLRVLQQLLPLSRPAAARLLVAQPALALQPAQSIRAAVDFLAAHLPPPPSPPPQLPLPPSLGPLLAPCLPQPPQAAAAIAPKCQQQRPWRQRQRQEEPSPALQQQRQPLRRQQQQLPPPQVTQLVMRCPDVLLLEPRRAAAALDCLTKIMAEVAATAQQLQVMSYHQATSYNVPYGDAPQAGRASGAGSGAGARSQRNPLFRWGASAAHAGDQLDGLADAGCGAGDRQAARAAAAALVRAAPRLLLCRLLPTDLRPRAGAGAGPGSRSGSGWGAIFTDSARERQTSILAWVRAVDEAQRKRRIDASSLALDGIDWPLPILSLPYNDCDGDSDATKGGGDRGSGVRVDEQQIAGREGPYDNHRHPRGSAASGADAAASLAALRAAAAAAGAAAVPIDLAVREVELLQLLGLELRYDGQSVPYGSVYDTTAALFHLRLWLWQHLVPAAPSVLLLPSSRLAATVDQLCSWLAVPPPALMPYLIPACPPPVPGLSVAAALAAAAAPPPRPAEVEPVSEASSRSLLPSHHVALLSVPAEALQRAAYRVWSWLGGGAAAAADDVAAVLRALPGLLYDSVTMRLCALVLHAALGGSGGGGGGDGYGNAAAAAPARAPDSSLGTQDPPPAQPCASDASGAVMGDVLLPAWTLVLPPPDVVAAHSLEVAAAGVRDAQTAVPAMPPEASALLLLHPAEILCNGVLRLLEAEPSSSSPPASAAIGMMPADAVEPVAVARGDVSGTGAGSVVETAVAEAAVAAARVSGGGTRLGRAVRLLCALLGISRLAAAVVLLTTRGTAAELLEQLPPSAMARIEKAVLLVRRGGAWRRELQRYLYGRTAVSGSTGAANLRACSADGGGVDEDAGGGLESLEAVSASAEELLVVAREWRRVGRLEALDAAGLEDAVSFTVALQMPEDDWQTLAVQLGLTRTAANTMRDG